MNSYDSLSSRRYQELVKRWSTIGTGTYGRYFRSLDAKQALADPTFPFSNVHLVLSTRPLTTDGLTLVAQTNGFKLYETTAAPIGLLQTAHFNFSKTDEAAIDVSTNSTSLPSHRVKTLDDFQKIGVTASPKETLLFLSQQYHRAWQAQANHRPLRTVVVNEFYQGVVLPPDTSEIELSFRPFVLWSWLPQLFFTVCAALLLLRIALRAVTSKPRPA